MGQRNDVKRGKLNDIEHYLQEAIKNIKMKILLIHPILIEIIVAKQKKRVKKEPVANGNGVS